MTDTCTGQVRDRADKYLWHDCTYPAKEDGLCGVHLAAKRKREAVWRERAEQKAAEKRRKKAKAARHRRKARTLEKELVKSGIKDFVFHGTTSGEVDERLLSVTIYSSQWKALLEALGK